MLNPTILQRHIANYGSSIKTLGHYQPLYTPYGEPSQDTRLASSFGNNSYYNDYVFTSVGTGGSYWYETLLNRADISEFQYILSGLNDYDFINQSSLNRWVFINLFAEWTGNNYIGQFKLKFSDSAILSVNDAVSSGYIEPLVLLNSFSFDYANVWINIMDILDGSSSTNTDARASMNLFIKLKNIARLSGVRFYSNINFSGSAGLKCFDIKEEYMLSINKIPKPVIIQRQNNKIIVNKYS